MKSPSRMRGFTIYFLLLACLATAGCGDGRPRTISVEGRITHQGRPLEGGELTFQPLEASGDALHRPAISQIAPDGTYRLSTFEQGDGVLPGEYAVAITSFTGPPPIDDIEGAERPSRIPLRFADPASSGLKATVPDDDGASISIDFDLP